jgi:amidase
MARQVSSFVSAHDVWLTPTLGKPPLEIGALYAKGVEATVEEAIARFQLGGLARRSGKLEEVGERVLAFMPFTMLVNGAGLPSMSVPLHWNAANVPIGVMLTGRFADEATLFRLAAQLERSRPWADRKPPTE